MRLVFLGYQTWGCVALRALIDAGHEVVLVITHPSSDQPYESIWSDSVAALAADQDIRCLTRTYANDDEVATLVRESGAALLVSSDWRTWLSPDIYTLVANGAINVHDGLLPRYGGFAPLNWAVVNGEKEVGVTVHFMNDEFDLGDIVLQRRVPAGPDETATDLFHRTLPLFAELTVEAVRQIADGTAVRTPQDPACATFFHKRSEHDSLIVWTAEPEFICRLVRAQSVPYPSAFTFHQGRKLEVLSASLSSRPYGGTAGRVFCRVDGGVAIVAGPASWTGANRAVVLHEVRIDQGQPLKAADYFTRMGDYLGGGA
jgi:methionyl-tRNA formyltransferase